MWLKMSETDIIMTIIVNECISDRVWNGWSYSLFNIVVFFFQAEDGIRALVRSRGLGDVYKRQLQTHCRHLTVAVVMMEFYFIQHLLIL